MQVRLCTAPKHVSHFMTPQQLSAATMCPLQAEELGTLLSRYDLRSHVNLIPWNPVDESPYERPSRNAVHGFADVLETNHRIPTSIRVTRGVTDPCLHQPHSSLSDLGLRHQLSQFRT